MSKVFYLCKLLIQKNHIEDIHDKMDVYLASDRLTIEEYEELVNMLNKKQE